MIILPPKISYYENKYKSVAMLTTDTTGGIVIPSGEVHAIHHIRATGAEPGAYTVLSWDYQGLSQMIFSSTRGDIETHFDISNPLFQLTGDGIKSLKIVIINNNVVASPIIGGFVELIKL